MWVFGYGSLMWKPGFDYIERRPARIHGYHRAFCIFSYVYRGTPEVPGLVFGLAPGGACRGVAFRVAQKNTEAVLNYLYQREMVTAVYRPIFVRCHIGDGVERAHTFVAEKSHEQYAGSLGIAEQANVVLQGQGRSGTCIDYLENTVAHLDELGIRDEPLHALLKLVRARAVKR